MKNKKGFTLIELIVSITIIAVLTAVGVVSYSGANKRARDSRRMADLEKIRIALELYRQSVGTSYPSSASLKSNLAPNYIQSFPTDPKTGYDYTYSSTGYKYTLTATVEDAGSSNVANWGYQVTNP